MIVTKDECVGCKDMGLPCLGDSCPNKNVTRMYCDECRHESEELRSYEGKQLCPECILAKHELIEEE